MQNPFKKLSLLKTLIEHSNLWTIWFTIWELTHRRSKDMESVTEKIPQPMTHTHIHPLTHISKIGAARINNTSPECGPILHRLTFRYEHVSIIVLNQSIILSNYLLANFRGLVLGCIEASKQAITFKPNFATKYPLENSWRDRSDLHASFLCTFWIQSGNHGNRVLPLHFSDLKNQQIFVTIICDFFPQKFHKISNKTAIIL